MAGASAVQVGCVNFVNPMAMTEVIDGLQRFMEERGFHSVAEMRGIAR